MTDPHPEAAPQTRAAQRHVPERTCVACRTRRPQDQFVRLTRVEGLWTVQGGRGRTGRGTYVCADSPGCWQEKKLRRAFGAQASAVASLLAGQAAPTGTREQSISEPPL